jgi:anti-sigma factor RsiW
MSTCTALSDRMPDVALGRSRWTEDEARHLASCADCRAEWALVAAASRLGASLPAPPDPAITGTRVLARLAVEPARARAGSRLWLAAGLAAAAAVALVVWMGRGWPGSGPPPTPPVANRPAPVVQPADTPAMAVRPPAAAIELPLPERDSLPAEALDSLLKVLDEPLARAGRDDATLGDAGDQELERALAGLEG